MKIKVLGSGCPKCKKLGSMVREALKNLGIEADVEKVTDMNRIVDYGVMLTPALVVDGEVKLVGKLPSKEKLEEILKG